MATFALANLVWCPIPFQWPLQSTGTFSENLGISLLFAQGSLLTIGFVFGCGPFWQRSLVVGIAASVVLGLWYAGQPALPEFESINYTPPEFLTTIAYALFLSLVGQTPMWGARVVLGWRFCSDASNTHRAEQQYSLADLLAGTVITGLAMGLMWAGNLLDPGPKRIDDHWLELTLTGLFGFVFSSLILLPQMGLFFSRMSLTLAWVLAIHFAFIVAVLTKVLLFGSGALGVMILAFAYTGAIGAACSVMRCCGVNWHDGAA